VLAKTAARRFLPELAPPVTRDGSAKIVQRLIEGASVDPAWAEASAADTAGVVWVGFCDQQTCGNERSDLAGQGAAADTEFAHQLGGGALPFAQGGLRDRDARVRAAQSPRQRE
jgi:hypothetical protein